MKHESRSSPGGLGIVSRFGAVWALAWMLGGCGLLHRLEVESVAKTAEPPSNVAVYMTVRDGKQPVTDLTEQSFRIYENNQLIAPEQSRQVLLGKDVALHRTLLLVDMSTAQDPAIRRGISRGAAGFVARVRSSQDVSVMAFDGRANPVAIGEFPKGGQGPEEIPELTDFQVVDPSRNLHGAIVKALGELDARLMTEKKPVRVGNLVVFTTGPDLAGRWGYEGLRPVIDKSGHNVFAIGAGDVEKGFSLDDLGRAGTVRVPGLTAAGPAFEEMGAKVDAAYAGHYLLSYCSPARDGTRMLKIEVVWHDVEGNEHTGTLYDEIDARGFGPGCDPSAPPRFGAVVAPAPPAATPEPGPPPAPVAPQPETLPPPAEPPPAE